MLRKRMLLLLAAALLAGCGKEQGTNEEKLPQVRIETNMTYVREASEAPAQPAGPGTVVTPRPGDADGTFGASDATLTVAGVSLEIGTDFLPYVDKLGETPVIAEGQACLEGGYDTNYYYGDELAVYTYAKDGKQIVYDIYITGAGYALNKGAQVGVTTREQLAELYGEPTESFPAAEVYALAGTNVRVSFQFENDLLSAIDILDSAVNGEE